VKSTRFVPVGHIHRSTNDKDTHHSRQKATIYENILDEEEVSGNEE